MSILSSENYKGVIFKFVKDLLEITATNPDFGESKEDMAIVYNGDSIEVSFNPRFFIETLSVIETDTIDMKIINSENPCMITGTDEDTYLSVIMPMRI